jgi:hypothetical protein
LKSGTIFSCGAMGFSLDGVRPAVTSMDHHGRLLNLGCL